MNKNIVISEAVKLLAQDIISNLDKVEKYYPIDRFFLDKYKYIEKINQVNKLEFILYHLEMDSNLYVSQLFVCIPDVWEKVGYSDLLILLLNLKKNFSYCNLIPFVYKYLKVDLLNEFFIIEYPLESKKNIVKYFISTLNEFYIDDVDLLEFKDNLFGVSWGEWENVQAKIKKNFKVNVSKDMIELKEILYKYLQSHK